ncbi:MAG: hypothetical protein RQ842_07725 [Vulcanisaeta sp.]|nr:hypothetical protein [Vulcanisaeta sp.]
MALIKVVFGSSEVMRELRDGSIALVVTSPPYYNAPWFTRLVLSTRRR